MTEEMRLQAKCVQWFKNEFAQTPDVARLLFEVNNNETTARKGAQRTAIGMTKGVSDCVLLHPVLLEENSKSLPDVRHYVAIEFKTPKGKQSEAQKNFQTATETAGGYYFLCRSFADFCYFFTFDCTLWV